MICTNKYLVFFRNNHADTDTLTHNSETISDHSIDTTQEQCDYDEQWGDIQNHLENVELTTTFENCEAILNQLDDVNYY